MHLEIERKFLVNGEAWRSPNPILYRQGYLAHGGGHSIRVRLGGGKAFLTIKAGKRGISRQEFEYPISLTDADALLLLAEGVIIEKRRHLVEYAGNTWEVDEFLGVNAPLVVAEIELASEAQAFGCPAWLGRDVSADPRYSNAALSALPYSLWVKKD